MCADKKIVRGVSELVPHKMTDIVHLVEMPLQPATFFQDRQATKTEHIESMEYAASTAENNSSQGSSQKEISMSTEQSERHSPKLSDCRGKNSDDQGE